MRAASKLSLITLHPRQIILMRPCHCSVLLTPRLAPTSSTPAVLSSLLALMTAAVFWCSRLPQVRGPVQPSSPSHRQIHLLRVLVTAEYVLAIFHTFPYLLPVHSHHGPIASPPFSLLFPTVAHTIVALHKCTPVAAPRCHIITSHPAAPHSQP